MQESKNIDPIQNKNTKAGILSKPLWLIRGIFKLLKKTIALAFSGLKKITSIIIIRIIGFFYAFFDSATPKWAKLLILSSLVYTVIPTDIIPDFIPVLGITDDLSGLSLAYLSIYKRIDEERIKQAQDSMNKVRFFISNSFNS